jgi:hypothetical protein
MWTGPHVRLVQWGIEKRRQGCHLQPGERGQLPEWESALAHDVKDVCEVVKLEGLSAWIHINDYCVDESDYADDCFHDSWASFKV